MSKFLITIMGPTASGKTALAIELARHFDTEIISADSRQFYKEMTIGTAKPSEAELAEVPHHFINHLSVASYYGAGKFEEEALQVLDRIFAEKDVAVMVGGSGLYINAVLFGIDPFPEIPVEIRLKTLQFYKENGLQALRDELRKYDPEYFLEVDLDNPRRLMRAVEVCYATGKPYSSFRQQKPKPRPFKSIKIAYDWDREELYQRINNRVDKMIEKGLIQECQQLTDFSNQIALDTIGYKEIFDFLDGKISKEDAIDLIKRNSRRYAKRQLTWFRNDTEINWFSPESSIESFIHFIQSKMLE
jgi:tRNA dimethylallyltransferase